MCPTTFLLDTMLARLSSSHRQLSPTSSAASWRLIHHAHAVAPLIVRPRHPAFQDLSSSLQALPEFRTRGDDVRVIYEPTDFYATLLVRSSEDPRQRGELIEA
jgi:hypothetical protein